MLAPRHSEICFMLNPGARLADVAIDLEVVPEGRDDPVNYVYCVLS